jgi:putative ABC transport system ATP-binding protein
VIVVDATNRRSPAVICRRVMRGFGHDDMRTQAVRDVDLDIAAGEVTLLVGPSGCGKTTLISIIAGILRPESGDVDVFGTRVSDLAEAEATRFRGANIGLVPQQFNLLPALTAAENVAVPLLLHGAVRRTALVRAVELLDSLGLGTFAWRQPSELSMGQQQRIAIARALIHEPRLVICDEPTAMLDTVSGLNVMRLLRNAVLRPDRAVVIVTHDDRILPFADRIATMKDGCIMTIKKNIQSEAA